MTQATRKAGAVSPLAASSALAGLTLDTATGPVKIDAKSHHSTFDVVIAHGGDRRLETVERLGQVAPDPGCAAGER